MGGGNAQKSATARARAQEKAKAGNKGSQLKTNAAAQSLVCQVCRQTFMCTSNEAKLREHTDGKHSKLPFEQCFPGFASG